MMKKLIPVLGALALGGHLGVSVAAPATSTVDYWATFSPTDSGWVAGSSTGTLNGGTVTVTNQTDSSRPDFWRITTPPNNLWSPTYAPAGMSNPGIFAANPIVDSTTNGALVIQTGDGYKYQFTFSRPIYNPRFLIFSFDGNEESLDFSGTQQSSGSPAAFGTVATANGANWSAATQTLTHLIPAGGTISGPEGCFNDTNRGCASVKFTGTYNALNFLYGGGRDGGIAWQVGGQSVVSTVDQSGSVPPGTSGPLFSLLTNDTLNGDPATASGVNVSLGATAPAGLTVNASGKLVSDGSLAAGTYVFDYTVCDKDLPTNCATSQVTVTVAVPTSVPTLSEYGLMLLGGLLVLLGLPQLRRRMR